MEPDLHELSTGTLDIPALTAGISEIIAFFEDLRAARVRVMLGWACNLPIDDLYQWQELPLTALQGFIEAHQRSGVFTLGGSDLFIENLDETAQFQLCHESDIHFITAGPALAEVVLSIWRAHGFTVYASTAKRAGPGLNTLSEPREWRQVN